LNSGIQVEIQEFNRLNSGIQEFRFLEGMRAIRTHPLFDKEDVCRI
jgi:hypothetical protein